LLEFLPQAVHLNDHFIILMTHSVKKEILMITFGQLIISLKNCSKKTP